MALPCVMMGSWSSLRPSQQSSSTHLQHTNRHNMKKKFSNNILHIRSRRVASLNKRQREQLAILDCRRLFHRLMSRRTGWPIFALACLGACDLLYTSVCTGYTGWFVWRKLFKMADRYTCTRLAEKQPMRRRTAGHVAAFHRFADLVFQSSTLNETNKNCERLPASR
jgi:hypothetical protein